MPSTPLVEINDRFAIGAHQRDVMDALCLQERHELLPIA